MQGQEHVVLWVFAALAVAAALALLWFKVLKRAVYLGPVRREMKKEKQWLRRGEYNAAMVKGRQNLEMLLNLVAELNGIQLDNTAQAVANARLAQANGGRNKNRGRGKKNIMTYQQFGWWLDEKGYLDRVAKWELNEIRLIGNRAVHENYSSKEEAWNQYRYLEDLLKILSESHPIRQRGQDVARRQNARRQNARQNHPNGQQKQGGHKKAAAKSPTVAKSQPSVKTAKAGTDGKDQQAKKNQPAGKDQQAKKSQLAAKDKQAQKNQSAGKNRQTRKDQSAGGNQTASKSGKLTREQQEEARRLKEERRLAEMQCQEEARRLKEERRLAEQKRQEEARKRKEERRLAEQKRQEEARKRKEERRLAEMQRQEEARKRKEERARKAAEQQNAQKQSAPQQNVPQQNAPQQSAGPSVPAGQQNAQAAPGTSEEAENARKKQAAKKKSRRRRRPRKQAKTVEKQAEV